MLNPTPAPAGRNNKHQLGTSAISTDVFVPAPVITTGSVEFVAAGDFHTCALIRAVTATVPRMNCWGKSSPSLKRPHGRSEKPLQTLLLMFLRNLTLDADSKPIPPQSPPGYNHYGQLGYGYRSNTDHFGPSYAYGGTYNSGGINVGTNAVKSFCLGTFHTCALLDGGTVKCWGVDPPPRSHQPRGGPQR